MADAQFFGANIGELRSLAQNLDQTQAGRIDEVRQAVQAMIDNLDNVWRGPDAQRFKGEWQSTHAIALQRAAESLRQAGQDARTNADRQEQTSSS